MSDFLLDEDVLEVIKGLGKNEIVIEADETAGVTRPDESKIGGKPYLPPDFKWPTFLLEDDEIEPLSFLCQINLADVKEYDKDGALPSRGMLYFFYDYTSASWGYDPDEQEDARVYYFEDTEGFVPLDIPDELYEESTIPEIKISFRTKVAYPSFEEFSEKFGAPMDFEEYYDILRHLSAELDSESEHKLIGYADIIQNEMLADCERISRGLYCGDYESYLETSAELQGDIEKRADDWTLILQLGTLCKGGEEWMFGDFGMIYFYVRKDDMKKGRFDDTVFFVQCT
jgi:uncharacterized protein YwqG